MKYHAMATRTPLQRRRRHLPYRPVVSLRHVENRNAARKQTRSDLVLLTVAIGLLSLLCLSAVHADCGDPGVRCGLTETR